MTKENAVEETITRIRKSGDNPEAREILMEYTNFVIDHYITLLKEKFDNE
jgi:hypothetical protein